MSKNKELFMYILASFITIGFFGIAFYMLKVGVYESTMQLFAGGLLAAFGTVVGYFFGSSKSNDDNTALLTNQQAIEKNKKVE